MTVIGAAEDDRDGVVKQGPGEFLRDVIGTPRIFEGQVELVFGAQHGIAIVRAFTRAVAKYVDGDILAQLAGVLFSPDLSGTVAHEPSNQLAFPSDNCGQFRILVRFVFNFRPVGCRRLNLKEKEFN
jgi:hypothetical protein